jgi:hypothetical protein
MKGKTTIVTLLVLLMSIGAFAQSKASNVKRRGTPKLATTQKEINTDHIGTWRLISQKVTYDSGNVFKGDSSTVFQRKVLTPHTFVVVIEKRIPNYDNKKLATSVAGGHYTLIDGNYEEHTEYATFRGFETMEIKYKLTLEDGKLHTVGTFNGTVIYDELYVRED